MWMWIRDFLGQSPEREQANCLYQAVVAQARQPVFYTRYGVADTVDGRFDMIALHLFLILNRLEGRAEARRLTQVLVNLVVRDMDNNLREMGVGDLSVGKKVKHIARALYGRFEAYQMAFGKADNAALSEAMQRNVYRSDEPVTESAQSLAHYARHQATVLAGQPVERLLTGDVKFAADSI